MGQKTHPKGFRLVTTQKHLSQWYSIKKNYPILIKEDSFIRLKTESIFEDFISISKIVINRVDTNLNGKECINVIVHALFPRAKEMSRKINKYYNEKIENTNAQIHPILSSHEAKLKYFIFFLLKKNLQSLVAFLDRKIKIIFDISIQFIRNPFENVSFIATFIGDQLKKRVPFRRVIKQTIKKVNKTEIKGIKVQVSGRLNGVEIARSEWKRNGRVPLHTLRAKIDYIHRDVKTIYGVIGIKVWLFIGE